MLSKRFKFLMKYSKWKLSARVVRTINVLQIKDICVKIGKNGLHMNISISVLTIVKFLFGEYHVIQNVVGTVFLLYP